ncbi:HRDC domain-containing protein [Holdemania filiformis]|uniref:HRDC domain-containing protein n=1 Tax=Holdemania filiformis TaxID=61171 RepID=UPI0022E1385E|nr:HRDC domain-containing protein [Holdemania filiformis]
MGANRARLKEVGTNRYKTYGALKKYSESQIRELIYELINQGYLIQSEDQYGVLKLGDISMLQDENTHVILKVTEEKTQEAGKLKSKQRNTDKLTSAGYVLFDALRKLRTDIAREEGLPPYIIFNDKTLIEMCVKLPLDEEAMLDIAGVGVNKLQKYGQRFLAVIVDFKKMHQEDKTSIQDDA